MALLAKTGGVMLSVGWCCLWDGVDCGMMLSVE